MTPDNPQSVEQGERRWMIYVCSECGDNCTLASGSEHGFFGTCHACEVGWMELDAIEVVPAQALSEVRRERDELEAELDLYGARFYDAQERAEASEALAQRYRDALKRIEYACDGPFPAVPEGSDAANVIAMLIGLRDLARSSLSDKPLTGSDSPTVNVKHLANGVSEWKGGGFTIRTYPNGGIHFESPESDPYEPECREVSVTAEELDDLGTVAIAVALWLRERS